MERIKLGSSELLVPRIAVGCMRIPQRGEENTARLIDTALERGFNFFDHADVYGGGGGSERMFAKAYGMTPAKREKIILQTKCGLTHGIYDASKTRILEAVDGSLQRLNTEYLDVLLLHRPDALMDPEEVAEAFDLLYSQGKVRHFGVSNQNPMQIRLLQKYVKQQLIVNQLQFSIMHSGMVDAGIHVNMSDAASVDHDGSVLDFCRLHDITIQPWSPFQYGFFEGVFVGNEKFPELNATLDRIAERYNVTAITIALAWILRHPAKMMPVTGTTEPERFRQCLDAAEITLTRDEWYEIYKSAGNRLP